MLDGALARWLGDAVGMRRWDKKRGTISECDWGLERLQNGSLLISLQCWQQWEGANKGGIFEIILSIKRQRLVLGHMQSCSRAEIKQ